MSRDFASKSGARSYAQQSSAHQNSGSGPSVLGRSLRVRGRLSGAGDLRIEGDVEGDVKVGGAFELGVEGSVTGNVAARSVTIDGALTGDVDAQGSVLIRAGARVSGQMSGSEIALEEGAAFSGRIEADFELPDGLLAGGGGPGGRRGGR